VLRIQANAHSTRLVVKFDIGNFLKKEEALDLLRQSGSSTTEKSIELGKRAVQTDPECGLAHNQFAWSLATGPHELRNAEQSLEHARRAVALEPGNQTFTDTTTSPHPS
jgi:hypothetical protein